MSKYILVVDDNPADMVLTSLLVSESGHLPIQAKNAYEALEKLDQFPFGAFIIDLQMPGMPGLELIKRIRSMSQFKEIPIVVQSGRREASDVRVALQLGASDYLVKPADPMIFEEKLKRIFGQSSGWIEYEMGPETTKREALCGETVDIASISEVGLTFWQKVEPIVGSHRLILSEFLANNDIGILQVTVKSFEKLNGKFKVKGTFAGMTESSLKRLRILCHQLYQTNMKKEAL